MRLTEVRINLCGARGGRPAGGNGAGNAGAGGRLRAFCSLTFDDTFVIRDVKLIEGNGGLFLAMPSRKLCDHCPQCNDKNHLRARFCNNCGARLDEERHLRYRNGNHGGPSRLKLHADIAHPINAECRRQIEQVVFRAYEQEIERSKQPGYVPPSLDGEDFEFYDPPLDRAGDGDSARDPAHPSSQSARLRPLGAAGR